MAPELLYHRPYDAKKVDVFAAGVILFVFYSGHPPFNQATENDPYYKAFVKSNEKFWDFHSKQNQKRNYSAAFKELVNSMLSFEPQKRCSFADIAAASKWFNEPIEESEALLKVAAYVRQMHQVKQQVVQPANNGDNRDGKGTSTLEELHALTLPDLKFEDLSGLPLQAAALNGVTIRSANKQLLTALVLKKALEAGGKKDEEHKEKLVLCFGGEKEQATTLDVKFYQVGAEEFEVLITRRGGDYFEFQKVKAQIQEAVLDSCEEAVGKTL